jgi:hypothetical protein
MDTKPRLKMSILSGVFCVLEASVCRDGSRARFDVSAIGGGSRMGAVAEPRFSPTDFNWNGASLRP